MTTKKNINDQIYKNLYNNMPTAIIINTIGENQYNKIKNNVTFYINKHIHNKILYNYFHPHAPQNKKA